MLTCGQHWIQTWLSKPPARSRVSPSIKTRLRTQPSCSQWPTGTISWILSGFQNFLISCQLRQSSQDSHKKGPDSQLLLPPEATPPVLPASGGQSGLQLPSQAHGPRPGPRERRPVASVLSPGLKRTVMSSLGSERGLQARTHANTSRRGSRPRLPRPPRGPRIQSRLRSTDSARGAPPGARTPRRLARRPQVQAPLHATRTPGAASLGVPRRALRSRGRPRHGNRRTCAGGPRSTW